MRLLNRTLITLVISAFFLAITSSLFQFYWVKNKIERRVDRKLFQEKEYIKGQLKDIQPEEGFSYNTERASVKFLERKNIVLNDSLFYYEVLDENGEKISYRTLQTFITIQKQNFKVEIRKQLEETRTFIQSIFITFFITLLVVILTFILLKYLLLKNTWNPFFETLKMVKSSDFQHRLVTFNTNVSVKEFNDLNTELNLLSYKIYNEFQSQKTFTENINHELMSPLAIIKGKLELIIQSENLNEQDLKLISDIFVSIDRLTKLNKSLVLLSKMDNRQFNDKINISIQELIDDILSSFEDQIRVQELKIRKQYNTDLFLQMNEVLAYTLFSNLIKNAIFHNYEKRGFITIILNKGKIEITNSGKANKLSQEHIFDRFVRESSSEDSIGLGLSIVHKICELHHINIYYQQQDSTHTFYLRVC